MPTVDVNLMLAVDVNLMPTVDANLMPAVDVNLMSTVDSYIVHIIGRIACCICAVALSSMKQKPIHVVWIQKHCLCI